MTRAPIPALGTEPIPKERYLSEAFAARERDQNQQPLMLQGKLALLCWRLTSQRPELGDTARGQSVTSPFDGRLLLVVRFIPITL